MLLNKKCWKSKKTHRQLFRDHCFGGSFDNTNYKSALKSLQLMKNVKPNECLEKGKKN